MTKTTPTKPLPHSPFWMPHVHADRRPLLLARNRIKAAIRSWFEAEGFTEVDPGCLQISPGNETHLHAFKTELLGTDLTRQPLYLHTSPEFAMKKLLAAGETKIFTFAPAFRNRERGALHAPEFTMLEWYRADAPADQNADHYSAIQQDCVAILKLAADRTGRFDWSWRGRQACISEPPERLEIAEAFARHLGMSGKCVGAVQRQERPALAAFAQARGHQIGADESYNDIFSRLVTEIEPYLGTGRSTLLTQYPASQSALAARNRDRPQFADRFELYCCGIELANGFRELTDPEEQRRRLTDEMAEKARIYGERYPLDEDFLEALAGMPQAAGCALGFDRLVMLATGAPRIDDVLWTPLPSAE